MRRDLDFIKSANENMATRNQYLSLFTNIALSRFKYSNLPDNIDERYLELLLFNKGTALFFKDDVLGYLVLPFIGYDINLYGIPEIRCAYGLNGYYNELNIDNSVIIYNNQLHENTFEIINQYAERLYELDRIIDVNAKAQKTPVLINCNEQQRLTLKNLYTKYEGNMPVIYANKNIDPDALKVLRTEAPYICDKIYELKVKIYNEALTVLGIPNITYEKKERYIKDEVMRMQGGVIASRFSPFLARQQAIEKINKMFKLNVQVVFRETENQGGDIIE